MLKLGSKFRNWILGDSERHSLNTETWMCIAVTRVLEAKLQHLLALLHCFQVLHQLACEDFGNFHHSYKGIPLYRASRRLCKDTRSSLLRTDLLHLQVVSSNSPCGAGSLDIKSGSKTPSTFFHPLLCCIQAVFPHICLVVSTFNVVSQAVACGW